MCACAQPRSEQSFQTRPHSLRRARGAALAEGHGLTAEGGRHGGVGRAVDVHLGPGLRPALGPDLGPVESRPRCCFGNPLDNLLRNAPCLRRRLWRLSVLTLIDVLCSLRCR